MKIPLFDIDGTLLAGGSGSPAHRRGFDYAFQTVFGLQNASVDEIVTDGKIDKQIILEVVMLHGISEIDAKQKLDEAIEAVIHYYKENAGSSTPTAAPGAVELLNTLQAKNVDLGLLTGNIESIAMDKLTRAGIADYFTFGAFGNLALKRVDLISVACERYNRIHGASKTPADFMIVGDSTLDVKCAKDGNIPVIGIGQANSSVEQLAAAGADLVFPNLDDTDAIVSFILEA